MKAVASASSTDPSGVGGLRAGKTIIYKFRHRIVGPVVVIWLALTIASVAVRTVVWYQLSNTVDGIIGGTRLSEGVNGLFSALQSAESSQRGFLLTGDDRYLTPFKEAETALSGYFSRLAASAAKDPVFEADLLKLRGQAELKMDEMRDTIKLRRDKGLTAALEKVNSHKGEEEMDNIRSLTDKMRKESTTFDSSAGEQTRRQIESGLKFTLFAGVSGIGAGLFALYLVRVGYLQEKQQRRLAAERNEAQLGLKEKSAFLANMSHEIRTPMNAILGFGELLEGESLTPRQGQYVRAIRQSGKSLLTLVNDVLDLSKLEAGKLELHLEPTEISELCNFLQTMFSQQAIAKGLSLQFDVEPMPRALLLDRLRLRQVLVNLVSNAIKFTDQGAVRTIVQWLPKSEDKSCGSVLISVEDTGPGISEEKQKEIFQPFVQSNQSAGGENQGTGLGLSIVHRFADMMGGAITLKSIPGKGSIFQLRIDEGSVSARLPVTDLEEETGLTDLNDFKPTTFLVVDDNESNRNLIVGMFERTHHQLRVAANGREAFESLSKFRADLVLLDIRMPVMDGRATLTEIRKLAGMELLPVIAVTASNQADDDREIRHRFSGYIRKPFSRRTLYNALAEFLPRGAAGAEAPQSPPPPAPPSGSLATARKAGDWRALTASLRQLHVTEWEVLRESLAIKDTQGFALKLHALARSSDCQPLTVYAELLAQHARTYSVRDLEKHLLEFPALLQTVEQHSEGT